MQKSEVELTVGVSGAGFVGGAVANGFQRITQVKVHDNNPKRTTDGWCETATCDVVFVCVPTPTCDATGTCDLTILDAVLARLAVTRNVGIVVVKSTVPPGVIEQRCTRYPGLRLISNPEFLTERNANADFLNPVSVVLGYRLPEHTCAAVVETLYRGLTNAPIIHVSHDDAALIKYGRNCFFAAKVIFFNELSQLCGKIGAGYEQVLQGILASKWVNPMHTRVPGPDGQYGYGGKCFPKDTRALVAFAKAQGVDLSLIAAAIRKNLTIRQDHDWKRIPGALS